MPPGFTCCPQIQKLADRSDVISEVPKCSKIQIFPECSPIPQADVEGVMKELMGQCGPMLPPPRIFGLEPPLAAVLVKG